MIDDIPNRPLYFHQKDILGLAIIMNPTWLNMFRKPQTPIVNHHVLKRFSIDSAIWGVYPVFRHTGPAGWTHFQQNGGVQSHDKEALYLCEE